MTYRVGVLVSGTGTNLQALLDAEGQDSEHPARIVLVGCNRADAPALERVRGSDIRVCVADRALLPRRLERQRLLLEALRAAKVDLVVLAGFDEVLAPEFVAAYRERIVNTHPSLLPAFSGTMHAVRAALEHGVRVTGCTIHLVTDDLDGGPILFQACVPVRDGDDEATLRTRIQGQEHQLLPLAVRAFAEGRVRVEGNRARMVGWG